MIVTYPLLAASEADDVMDGVAPALRGEVADVRASAEAGTETGEASELAEEEEEATKTNRQRL